MNSEPTVCLKGRDQSLIQTLQPPESSLWRRGQRSPYDLGGRFQGVGQDLGMNTIARKPPVWGFRHFKLPPGPAMLLLRTPPFTAQLLPERLILQPERRSMLQLPLWLAVSTVGCPKLGAVCLAWYPRSVPGTSRAAAERGIRKAGPGRLPEDQSVHPGRCARGCCGGG